MSGGNPILFAGPAVTKSATRMEDHIAADIIQRFHDLGVRPDWWKLEPMRNDAAWSRTCGAVERNDLWCRGIVVSGRGECEEIVAESLAAAARHASVKGFAAGRTIFAPAARAWLAGGMDVDEAVADMAARYRRLCASWDAARGVCTACSWASRFGTMAPITKPARRGAPSR